MAFTPQLPDDKAIRFTEAFYSSLVAGLSIQNAFEMAKLMVAEQGSGGVPLLFDSTGTVKGVLLALLVSDEVPTNELDGAVRAFAKLIDAEVVVADAPVIGSFFRRIWLWIKSDTGGQQRLREIEEALLAQGRDVPMSKVASEYALAIERIMNALSKPETPARVAFVMDSLLVLRYPGPDGAGAVVVKQLSREEVRRLAVEPSLMNSPQDLLSKLMEYAQPPAASPPNLPPSE